MTIFEMPPSGSEHDEVNEPDTVHQLDDLGLVYQELPVRVTNPVKLVALLRMQFGVGKYEVCVSGKNNIP